MKKFIPIILAALSALVLTACPDTKPQQPPVNPPPPPPPPSTTLYQGDWTLTITNANNPNDRITGLVSFNREARNSVNSSPQYGKLFAYGAWDADGINQKPLGPALMGAISTPLDIGLLINNQVALVATDTDERMGRNGSGRDVFLGSGVIFDAQGQPSVSVRVQLVHQDTTPTYTASDGGAVAPSSSHVFVEQLGSLLERQIAPVASGASLNDVLKQFR